MSPQAHPCICQDLGFQLLFGDAIMSMGGHDVEVRQWGIDLTEPGQTPQDHPEREQARLREEPHRRICPNCDVNLSTLIQCEIRVGLVVAVEPRGVDDGATLEHRIVKKDQSDSCLRVVDLLVVLIRSVIPEYV